MDPTSVIASLHPDTNLSEPEQRWKKCLQKMNKTTTYQYIILIYVAIGISVIVFNVMISSFVFMNPIYECQGGEKPNQKQACDLGSYCHVVNDFTASYKNDLLCDKQIIRSTIQSALGYGYIAGRSIFPILTDVIGRRRCILTVWGLGILTMSILLLSIEYNSTTFMMIGQGIAGVFGSSLSTTNTLYICDFCCGKIRLFGLTNIWAVWGIAEMFFFLFYNVNPGWRIYLTSALLIPASIVFLLLLLFMIQSPVYAIFTKKNPEMFEEIIEKLSLFNKFPEQTKQQIKQEGREIIELLKKEKKSNENYLKKSLIRVCTNKNNLKVVIVFICINLSFIFFYFGMQGSMESAGYDFGLNMLIVGSTQFFSYFFIVPVITKMRRKPGIFLMTLLNSAVGMLFIFQFMKGQETLQTVIVAVTRVFSNFVFSLFHIFFVESLEVQVRSVSFSLVDGISEISRIILPYAINIMYGLNIKPIVLFSIVSFAIGALPVLVLKQTVVSQEKEKLIETQGQEENENVKKY